MARPAPRAVPLAAVFLLLLVPTAGAAVLSATAQEVAADPPGSLTGAFRGLQFTSCNVQPISLQASILQGEVDETRYAIGAAGVVAAPEERSFPVQFEQVRMTWQAVPNCRVFLESAGRGATVGSTFSQLRPAEEGLAFDPMASTSRQPTKIPATLALEASLVGTVTVTGDFRLTLWGANISVSHAAGQSRIETGSSPDQVVAGIPAGNSVEREAYFTVYNGSVTLPSVGSALLNDAGLRLDKGSLHLSGSEMHIGSRIIQGQAALSSPVRAGVASESGHVAVRVDETGSIEVDGSAVSLPTDPQGPTWIVWTTILVLLGAIGGEVLRRNLQIRRLVGKNQYRRIDRAARPIAWLPFVGRTARLARAVALLKMHRFETARKLLTPYRPWRTMQPTWNFLWAHLSAATGDSEGALESLTECLAMAPSYLPEAQADPILRPIVAIALERAQPRPTTAEGYA